MTYYGRGLGAPIYDLFQQAQDGAMPLVTSTEHGYKYKTKLVVKRKYNQSVTVNSAFQVDDAVCCHRSRHHASCAEAALIAARIRT